MPTFWNLQASAGAPGTSLFWRGPWSSSLSYNPYDAVQHTGSSYIAVSNNTNVDPASDSGSHWQLLASAGSAGAGTGDVTGPASAVSGEIATYANATGKQIGRLTPPVGSLVGTTATQTLTNKTLTAPLGIVKADVVGAGDVSGPASATNGNIALYNGTTGKLIKNGPVPPVGTIVGTTDTQTLTNKTFSFAGTSFRPNGILIANGNNVSATGGSDVNVWTYNLPAGFLSKDGDMLRFMICHSIDAGTSSKEIKLYFNGVLQYTQASVAATVIVYFHTIICTRQSATSQRWSVGRCQDNGSSNAEHSLSSADTTLAIPIVLAMRGAGTSNSIHRSSMLEFLPMP